MRILHISTRLILGGSQENTILSCEGQARLGHHVHLAFGPIYGPEGSMLDRVRAFRTPAGAAITDHTVPDMIRAVHPWRDWRATAQLRRLIREIRPDVVHTHSSKAGIIGRAAAWAVLRADPKRPMGVVHTIHGPPFYNGQNPLVRSLYIHSERFAAKRCHAIVSVADAMTRQYLAEGIGRADQYRTVYSGMEIAAFLDDGHATGQTRDAVRARLGFAPGDLVVGTVARLADQKGHDDLLSAVTGDLAARPHVKLLWVGDGWLRERLLARAAAMGLSISTPTSPNPGARLVLTGLVPPEHVPRFMCAMDVLAHPSSREGLPRTVPQALLSGVCPVAYDVDGTGEACREMQTGRLVPHGDVARLREAILWCDDQPQHRARLAEAGRAWCVDRFSAERMVRDLEEVYARAFAMAGGSWTL